MQRNSNAWGPLLILLVITGLILGPLLISGYNELGRAEEAQQRGDHQTASQDFAAAARRLLWRSELWERAGMEALQAGEPQAAVQFLERSRKLSRDGWAALGRSYQQLNQPELALDAFQTALGQGASAQIYMDLAELYRQDGDLPAERTALENSLLLEPGAAAQHYRLGLLLSLSDLDSALAHLQLAAQLDAEYEPVAQTMRSALVLADLSPTQSERSVMIGRALGLVGEWRLARLAFQQAVETGPQNALAWAWLGEAKQHLGQEAALEMEKAAELDSQSAVVRGLRGLFWKRQGKQQRALEEYQAAAASEPQNPVWAASLGESYAGLGDLVLALQNYQRATELAPGESLYWRLLATFCLEYNLQVEEIGLPAAMKARQLSENDPLALDILGWSQLEMGETRAARENLLEAIRLAPDFALAHYHLALAYLQSGERAAAKQELNLVVQLDPDGGAGALASQLLEQQFP